MSSELRIFVPRLMDAANTNAQNLNARALLSRFTSTHARWVSSYYDKPDPRIAAAPRIELSKLWRTRLWHWHTLVRYQQTADAIFYPGMEWFDARGLAIRERFGRKIPVIGLLEGLAGDETRERRIESIVGHKVFCHRVGPKVVDRCDRILGACDHIIAITPMLEKVGRDLYGDKMSMLPLGLDTNTFHPSGAAKGDVFRVIGVGNLKENKRPEIFIELARRFPHAEFIWFGQGPLLSEMQAKVAAGRLTNVQFPGTALPSALAGEYNRSDLFLLPSSSEGAPKVLQEAAACALPRIAFGFYEPTISDGVDGFVVWSDDELFARVDELVKDRAKARAMGSRAVAEAIKEDWNLIAPQWENEILNRIYQLRSR